MSGFFMLQVKNLHKRYPGESLGAVNDISFEMNKGEVIAFVGQSGSGKTTLLRMIAGLIKPDSGTISYQNELFENPEEQLIAGHEKIKLVHQDYKLKPNMTVRENIQYQLLHFDKDFQKERTNELLALCHLEELSTKPPHELSGGQQQRLAIARALSEEPEILLLDEPFSSLDPMTKEDLLFDLLHIAHVEATGIILVTHDTTDALKISTKVGFIQAGRIIQITGPRDIYNSPVNIDVAKFFGRVNSIEVNGETCFVRAEYLILNPTEEYAIEAELVSSSFMGRDYLNYAQTEQGVGLWFYSKDMIDLGEKVLLGFKKDDFILDC